MTDTYWVNGGRWSVGFTRAVGAIILTHNAVPEATESPLIEHRVHDLPMGPEWWNLYPGFRVDRTSDRFAWTGAGFGYSHWHSAPGSSRDVLIPMWFIVAATLSLPGIRLLRMIRFRMRRAKGLCPRCGYDLRATPDRCPECGAVAASKEAA